MRRTRRMFDENQSENYYPDERYNVAYKRVKRIKGFYVHAMVYVFGEYIYCRFELRQKLV